MKANITIISINSKALELKGRETNRVYAVEVPEGKSPEASLEAAFAMTNHDDRPYGNSVCSTSPGDIMILAGTHYLVEGSGYRKLTIRESFQLQALTSRDTSFGYDFLVRENLLTVG